MSNDSTTSRRDIEILLVEDDEIDVEVLRRAFQRHGLTNDLVVAGDGPEALAYLRRREQGAVESSPVLVLLDLNLPTMSGFDVLQQVRADANLRRSVVFVLSTSEREKDRRQAYDMNVAAYLVKGRAGPELDDICHLVSSYCAANQFP